MFNAPRKYNVHATDISKVLLMSLTFPVGLLGGTQIEISPTKGINMAFPTSLLRFLCNLDIIVHFSESFDFSENAKVTMSKWSKLGNMLSSLKLYERISSRNTHYVYYLKFSHWAYPSFGQWTDTIIGEWWHSLLMYAGKKRTSLSQWQFPPLHPATPGH